MELGFEEKEHPGLRKRFRRKRGHLGQMGNHSLSCWGHLLLFCVFPATGLADPPVVGQIEFTPASPLITLEEVSLSVLASDPEGDPIEFRWDFGDGTPQTEWTLNHHTVQHTFGEAGVWTVLVQVRAGVNVVARAGTVVVVDPVTNPLPTRSSPILFDSARNLVWVVNSDHSSVTAIAADLSSKTEILVCERPKSLALDPFDILWITCRDGDAIARVDAQSKTLVETLDLGYGSAPEAVVRSPDGATVYVVESGRGTVRLFDTATGLDLGSIVVGDGPRALAVTADGWTLLVTRFLSTDAGGEIRRVDLGTQTLLPTIELLPDTTSPDSGTVGRGVPNLLTGLAVDPAGGSAWVVAKKDNIFRGQFVEGTDLKFDSTSRSLIAHVDLTSGLELSNEREDVDDHALPGALMVSPLGSHLFVTFPGNQRLVALVTGTGAEATRVDTGAGPIGVTIDPATQLVYVLSELDRSIQVYDAGPMLTVGATELPWIGSASTVDVEVLQPELLLGKRVFSDARDSRMASEGYLSCATCHFEGGHDGRVWDFTQGGEGLRNTTSLRGFGRSGQGLIHWSGNFDEVQDFETPIRDLFGGSGFLSEVDYQATIDPLGTPKDGLSVELDALAAYVNSLDRVDRSPYRATDGSLTAAGHSGRLIFEASACVDCHHGPAFTDSATGVRHDVGTLTSGSGSRLGGPLDGLDTPSLLGVWNAAPYLHLGSTEDLRDVVTTLNSVDRHGVTNALMAAEIDDLVAYLLQVDGNAVPFPVPGSVVFEDGFESGSTVAWSSTSP